MKILIETFENTGSLHHAYALEGEKEVIREKLLKFIGENLKHPTQGNPDFHHEKFETFTVDDARRLKDMQALRPSAYPRKIYVLEIFSMTVEAQNALLKIFEEPSPETHFFIITLSSEIFLPTLRSRLVVISDDERSAKGKSAVRAFIESSPADRMKLVAGIIEEKDKARAAELFDGVILEFARQKAGRNPSLLKELLTARSFLADRSPSLKIILEHFALILPR